MRGQRGEGQAGCIFGLILLLIGVFVAYKLIPVKVHTAELRQTVEDESKSASNHDDAHIMKAILEKADSEHLPVTEDNVKLNRHKEYMVIDVEYDVPVAFPGKTIQWHVHHHAENPIF